MTTTTPAGYRVTVLLHGKGHAIVKVSSNDAATVDEAREWAIDCALRAEGLRAFRVRQSGGPSWAAQAAPRSAFTTGTVRSFR